MKFEGLEWWKRFKLLFDWSVGSVTKPRPQYMEFKDAGKILLGYNVIVVYKHHGKKDYFFACDEEKLGLASRECAYRRAEKFYNRKKQEKKGYKMKKFSWKDLFNWEIAYVLGPREMYDVNGAVLGYRVTVKYKKHSDKEFVFRNDDAWLYKAYGNPQNAAQVVFQSYENQRKRQQNASRTSALARQK